MSPDYYSIRNGALADDLRAAGFMIEIEHFGEGGSLRKVTLSKTPGSSSSAMFMDTAELYWFLLGAHASLYAAKVPEKSARLTSGDILARLRPLRELREISTESVTFEGELVASPMSEEADG